MTHPNVEYFRSRIEVSEARTEEVKEALVALMSKHDGDVAAVAQRAYGRLYANFELTKTLMQRIEDYEERIALLS